MERGFGAVFDERAARIIRGRPHLWSWLAAVVLVPLTWHRVWQRPPFLPVADFDASWQAALHLVAHERLSFGGDVVFPYGPLGFLALPVLYFGSTAGLAFVAVTLGRLALLALVLRGALRAFPWPVALVLAYVVGTLPIWDTDLPLAALLFCAVLALERSDSLAADLLVALAGPLVALQLLVKTNVGLVAAVIAVAALAGALPRARLGLAAVWAPFSFAATFVLLWLASGSALGDIPAWIRSGKAFVAGYSQGLALEASGLGWNYGVAAAMLVLLAGAVWVAAASLALRPRAGLVVVALAFAYGYFKEGFVRHDVHATFFFGAIATAAVAFARRPISRWVALVVVALGVAGVLRTGHAGAGFFNPVSAARAYGFEVRALVQPGRRRSLTARAKADVRAAVALDGRTLALLRGRTVHVEPYATDAIWAYGLDWRPLPVFQENVVDTTSLDARNVGVLRSAAAPERILRERVATVDGEAPQLEAPGTFLELLCRYRLLAASGRWQVLALGADRCGSPRLLGSVDVSPGARVRVPTAGPRDVVFARLHLSRPFLTRIGDALFKPLLTPRIVVDRRSYRFRPTTASDPQVLRVPAAAGWSPLRASSFRLEHWGWRYRVDFYAVALAPR
jgi:hypothetical protein